MFSATERVDGMPATTVRLPFPRAGAGGTPAPQISLLVPAEPHALLHEHDVYWAGLWPASLALADYLFAHAAVLPQQTGGSVPPILELGCGLGLGAIAAALAGGAASRVLATDIDPRALAFTQANAERNGCAAQLTTRVLDWRAPYAEQHRLILGADGLYDPLAGPVVARFLAASLEPHPDARALLVDPQRHSARNFHYLCREQGLNVRVFTHPAPFVAQLGPLGHLDAAVPAPQSGHSLEVTFYDITRTAFE